MNRRCIRFLVLVWLGWYVSGPLATTVDFWDSPEEEISDIARSAGGEVTLVAAVFCVGLALSGKLRELCSFPANVFRWQFLPSVFEASDYLVPTVPSLAHSPPLPLRI